MTVTFETIGLQMQMRSYCKASAVSRGHDEDTGFLLPKYQPGNLEKIAQQQPTLGDYKTMKNEPFSTNHLGEINKSIYIYIYIY